MSRPLITCLTIAITAAVATAAACDDAAIGHPSVALVDDHASWIERDLWQFQLAVVQPAAAARSATVPSVATIDADAEHRSWMVRDRWQFAAAPDAEYLSWLVRDLWQFERAHGADRPPLAGR